MKQILISGAGVAGLTLAYWLKKHGFSPVIVEKSPAMRNSGYKIDIRGSALEVVRRMGIHQQIKALKTDVQGSSLALVGAYVLAGELKKAAGDYNRAFANYNKKLKRFVDLNQKLGVDYAKNVVKKENALRTGLHEILMSLFPKRWLDFQTKCSLKRFSRASNAITMDHY